MTCALLMNSDALPLLVTVIDCDALVVPVSCAGKVSDDGVKVTAGADVDGGGEDGGGEEGVQPLSVADFELDPSLTVTWQVDEL